MPDILISLLFAIQTIVSNKDRLQEHQSDTSIYVLFSVSVSILSEHAAFTFLATLTTHHWAGTGLLPCKTCTQRPFHLPLPFHVRLVRRTVGTVGRRHSPLSLSLSTRSNAYTSALHFWSSGSYSLIPVTALSSSKHSRFSYDAKTTSQFHFFIRPLGSFKKALFLLLLLYSQGCQRIYFLKYILVEYKSKNSRK